jgi:hypothetical protein
MAVVMTGVGGQRAEVGGRRSEGGDQRAEVRGPRSAVRSQRFEVTVPPSDLRSPTSSRLCCFILTFGAVSLTSSRVRCGMDGPGRECGTLKTPCVVIFRGRSLKEYINMQLVMPYLVQIWRNVLHIPVDIPEHGSLAFRHEKQESLY